MNFYKKLRSKTTLTPLEVVNKMKEISPIVNKNLTVEKYLQCEQGKRKMKGIRFNSFMETINGYKENPTESKINELNDRKWFDEFRQNYQKYFADFNIFSQKQLSELTGISQPTISEMLKGEKPISKENIQKIKEFFEDDMNVQDVVIEENEEQPRKMKQVNISDEDYKELMDAFIKKAKESGKSYSELGKILHVDNTTVGKIIRGSYKSRGPKIIEVMKSYINGETIDFVEPEKVVNEKDLKEWNKVTKYVKNLKFKEGISLHKIAKLSGVSEGTLSCIINDKYEMTPTMLIRLKEFYDLRNKPTEDLYVETEDLITENIEENVEEITEDDICEIFENENTENVIEEEQEVESEEEFNESDNEEFDAKDHYISALRTIVENQDRIIRNYETLIEVIRKYQDIA